MLDVCLIKKMFRSFSNVIFTIFYFVSKWRMSPIYRCLDYVNENQFLGAMDLYMIQNKNNGMLLIKRGSPVYSWLEKRGHLFGKMNLFEDGRNLEFLFPLIDDQCCDIFGTNHKDDSTNLTSSHAHWNKVILHHLIEEFDLFHSKIINPIAFLEDACMIVAAAESVDILLGESIASLSMKTESPLISDSSFIFLIW